MIRNVGAVDRAIRLVAGIVLLALVFVGPQTRWGYIGLVLIATAAVGYCPLYQILGVSTCPAKPHRA